MDENETLTLYLDGQLVGPELAAFEARLASDAVLAAQAERLRGNDANLRAAFNDPMLEPVPDRLLALLGNAAGQSPGQPVATPSNDNARVPWRWGSAVAASLAIGLLLGSRFATPGVESPVVVSTALNDALDSTASGRQVALKGDAKLTPLLTFASTTGSYCRQFTLSSGPDNRAGVACRGTGARWHVEALLPTTAIAAGDGGYAAAGGDANPALDAVAAKLRSGDPLSAGQEQAMIRRRWQPE